MVDANSISLQQARRQLAGLLALDPEGPGGYAHDQTDPKVIATIADLRLLLGTIGGFIPSGIWDAGTTYTGDEVVAWDGSIYAALAASTNVEPGSDDTKWVVVVQKGDKGDKGDPGQDLVNAGDWDDSTTYAVNEMVFHDGGVWAALVENTDSEPEVGNTDWAELIIPQPRSWGGMLKELAVMAYVLEYKTVCAGRIESISMRCYGGTGTMTLHINGTPVVGANGVTVEDADHTYTATDDNEFPEGVTVDVNCTAITGTPVRCAITVKWRPTA